jgi:hypothetical protein
VRVCETHHVVPLFWQCWKLDSPIVGRITDALRSDDDSDDDLSPAGIFHAQKT